MKLKTLAETPSWNWPEDAGKTLARMLRDKKATESDRVLAAELAGDMMVINEELVDLLLSILGSGDESEDLRGMAAIAVGPVLEDTDTRIALEEEELAVSSQVYDLIRDTMHRFYLDTNLPKAVRRRILEGSVRAPQDWHRDAILTAYASDDEDWKLTAVFCMGFVRGFDQQILESLETDNPDIHLEAVTAAGNWEIKQAWSHVSALADPDRTAKPLLLAAIEATALINPDEAELIIGHLVTHRDEEIALTASESLAMIGRLWGDEDEEELFS